MSGVDHIAVFKRDPSAAGDANSDALRLAWSEEAWRKLLVQTEPRRFRAGDVVIQRGDMDRALYFVVAGSLEVGVYRISSEGTAPITRIGVGSVIGEQSFFDGQPCSTNVWAVSDGELLRLSPEAFDAFGAAEPALARDLLLALGRVLSVRLRNTTFRTRSKS